MEYSWKAASNDGSYEAQPYTWFATKEDAYNDMRDEALEKIRWNTEFYDVEEKDTLGYSVHFSQNKIVHESYSGVYTYEIVQRRKRVYLHNREWDVIDSFTPKEMYDWLIATFDEVGEMWMNNHDGYIVLIEPSGRILKSDI